MSSSDDPFTLIFQLYSLMLKGMEEALRGRDISEWNYRETLFEQAVKAVFDDIKCVCLKNENT